MNNTIIVTGGAGFIGSSLVKYLVNGPENMVVNIDKLSYSGNLESLKNVSGKSNYTFKHTDICDEGHIERIIETYRPTAIIHLAAESHVDRSIDGPSEFIRTNILGTYTLLEKTYGFWKKLSVVEKERFRYIHVSTDEVYGALGPTGKFSESSPYDPRSPYSASKASSDHLARSWFHTYDLPVIITNCSNNYGPFQYPEKLIPVIILNAIRGKPIPVYGKGENVRDWLYVEDHVKALITVLEKGKVGHTYNIGGNCERKNIEVVLEICKSLDELAPHPELDNYSSLIEFVADRPGHDFRYAIDSSKITIELDWNPKETFETGLRKTVEWYLDNLDWCEAVMKGKYNLERIGVNK